MSDLYKVFDDSQQRKSELYAALDMGSNSFHLVVARVVADAVQIVSKVKQKVRLAEGLDSDHILSDEAIVRGVKTLESMQEALQGVDPSAMRIVATHTLRRAKNARAFLRAAKKVFPYPIEIISGSEEARLIFVGVGSHQANPGEKLVFDIGGGSTEFALGQGTDASMCKSLQMGCVVYNQRYFSNGDINKKNTSDAITAAKVELEIVAGKLKNCAWQHTIASSGTARSVCASINLNLQQSIDTPVSYSQLQQLLHQCIKASHYTNLNFDGLSDDRKPVFVAGLCILLAIYESLQLNHITFSEAALREGVIYELQPTHSSQNVRVRTAQSLATRYDVDTTFAHKVLTTSMHIFDSVSVPWELNLPHHRHLLGWSALLHEVGLHINSRSLQKHSSYVLLNSELPGFNQDQQSIIAQLVRYHRKKVKWDDISQESSIEHQQLCYLLAILRISVLLNINRHKMNMPAFSVKAEANSLYLKFEAEWFSLSPLLLADLTKENTYLKALDINLSIL
ncbi:MAG: exopolyphosphatase [Glaciecola sp.]